MPPVKAPSFTEKMCISSEDEILSSTRTIESVMPPRPFALPLSIGTDIVSIQRIYNILSKTKKPDETATKRLESIGQRFARQILCQEEWDSNQKLRDRLERWDEFLRKKESAESVGIMAEKVMKTRLMQSAQFLAGRFAAKEAAIKAHTKRRLLYKDIWIQAQPKAADGGSTAPVALIRSEEGWEDAQICPVSLSHDLGDGTGEGWAVATCMAWEGPLPIVPADEHVKKNSPAPKPDREVDFELEEAVDSFLRERGFEESTTVSGKKDKPVRKGDSAKHEPVRKIPSELRDRTYGRKSLVRTGNGKRVRWVEVRSQPNPKTVGTVVRAVYAKGYERENESDKANMTWRRKWSRRGLYSVPFLPTKEQVWHEGPMPRSLLSKLAGVRKALRTFKDPPP